MHICSTKKLMLRFTAFTGISVACMDFRLSNILISLSASSLVFILKQKHSLVNFEAIAIMPEYFLYLAIAFKEGCSAFSDKGSNFSNFRILRLITAFEKNCSVSL